MEMPYDFRKRLLNIHREDMTDASYVPDSTVMAIDNRFSITIPKNCERVIWNAANDLQQYLLLSHNISVPLVRVIAVEEAPQFAILIGDYLWLKESWEEEKISGSYRLNCTPEKITITGFNGRGCAQGCYRLEDEMTKNRAPYVPKGQAFHAPMFSPRMIHSGYGLDQFPDAHLSAIAHSGMDSIIVFVEDVDKTPCGYSNFNELIYRAEGYGLDVYAYVFFISQRHPEDADAFEFYDSFYGKLFRSCPKLKGVVLVGESVEFPTKDLRASKLKMGNNWDDGIYLAQPSAGNFPCSDYHQWVRMIQDVIYQQNPNADIVFWTYNWGYAPEEDRLALIRSLPRDISLMATFEMFQQRELEGLPISTVDYTLSYVGPGDYFASEAKCAKECGIRLYTQSNTGGLTWDFGVIPYEPCPMQWAKRYDALREAKEKYGLSGIMESHHYGFWPSFISRIEKAMFTLPAISAEEAIAAEAKTLYGKENISQALTAWEKLSEGIRYYVSANEDQYGPFRVGPAYPMVFRSDVQIPTVPYAMYGGNTICFTDYASDQLYRIISHTLGHTGLVQQRIPKEVELLGKMRSCFREGRMELEKLLPSLDAYQRQECEGLINLVHFIENCVTTTIHVKQWNVLKWKTRTETDGNTLIDLMKQMQKIGYAEIENAEQTIPLVQKDSRLGWEPSMEYIGGERHLNWKIRQTRMVVEEELPTYMGMVLL